MGKFLAILAIATIGSGCATAPVDYPIGIPPRPQLINVPQEVWDRVPIEAQDIWSHNDLALKKYARELEGKIKIHDDSL